MLQNIVNFCINVPKIVLAIFLHSQAINRCKEYAEKPFVCPNCGETFYVKWYHLWNGRECTLVVSEKAKVKCPHCKQTDMCRWITTTP